ncbi:MAG: hypothetical protein DLM59_01545 [Pseudonocardiales bacterium]|nr:MAG: hypothetical protein DLM59_01545 [Pseudonocardiales bacterium]
METATVLYDANCALCQRAKAWLESQEQLLRLEFVPAASPEARHRYPGLDHLATLRDLTVVADTGEVWRAERAWVLCLWACAEHRLKAERLATPAMLPLARHVFAAISENRAWLGSIHV